MKKRKIVFWGIFLTVSYLLYLALEPYSLNVFSENPTSQSKSTNNIDCDGAGIFDGKANAILDSMINADGVLGISAGIYFERCGNWLGTAGFLSKKSQIKTNESSKFRIASVSKPMTAVAILQLYERGKIDLDVAIQRYLPEFPKKEKGVVTIRQLLNHTSGVPHYRFGLEIFHFSHYENCSEALKRFEDRELAFEPRTSFLYSSYGYTLLGAILERVSGKILSRLYAGKYLETRRNDADKYRTSRFRHRKQS